MRGLLAVGCLAALLTVNVWAGEQVPKGNATNGQAIYARNCLPCHGAALDGHGPNAAGLVRPPANFLDKRSRKKTDFELEITIKQGQLYTDMHRWDNTLSDAQIRDVVAYIRATAPHLID